MTTAFIFARGGSKGIPRKNIKTFVDRPLIAWSIEQALACKQINRVVVSTDNEEIARIAKLEGAQVPFLRPSSISADDSSEWDAWCHAIKFMYRLENKLPDPFVSVPCTAPLRVSSDIEACIEAYHNRGADAVITVSPSRRSPWFNMVKKQEDGTVRILLENGHIVRRQDAAPSFDITTVAYVANPHFILSAKKLFDGKVIAVEIPDERAIDIDEPHDFEIAEFLMNKRLSKQ